MVIQLNIRDILMSEVHTTVINESYHTIPVTITLHFGLFTSFKLKDGILLLMFTYESTCDKVSAS